jgi:hypothetical protein
LESKHRKVNANSVSQFKLRRTSPFIPARPLLVQMIEMALSYHRLYPFSPTAVFSIINPSYYQSENTDAQVVIVGNTAIVDADDKQRRFHHVE